MGVNKSEIIHLKPPVFNNGKWNVKKQNGSDQIRKHENTHLKPPVFNNGNGMWKEGVGVNKSENSGWTSVDRSTKATLSTYNTWIHVSRLQKIYHFQSLKLWLTTKPLTVEAADMQQGRDLMLDM